MGSSCSGLQQQLRTSGDTVCLCNPPAPSRVEGGSEEQEGNDEDDIITGPIISASRGGAEPKRDGIASESDRARPDRPNPGTPSAASRAAPSCMDTRQCRCGSSPDGPASQTQSRATADPTESEVLTGLATASGGAASGGGRRSGGVTWASDAVAAKRPADADADCAATDPEKTAGSGRPSRSQNRGRKLRERSGSRLSEGEGPGRTKSARMANLLSGRWGKQPPGQEIIKEPSQRAVRPSVTKAAKTYSNGNMPQDYRWLESVLENISQNEAGALGCKDTSTGKAFVPVFLIIGGCPNMFCGMQAIMYCVGGDGEVDFWWIKPGKGDASGKLEVEVNTLSRNAKGPHKNDPGRSKPLYKPLADFFSQGQTLEGVRFGMEKAAPGQASRAFLEQTSGGGLPTRQYLVLVWQEDWTSNPFARSKYIKGKIVYQKDPQARKFFSRQYYILNGAFTLSSEEGPPFGSVLPGEDIKDLKAD